MLADNAMDLHVCRLAIRHCAWLIDQVQDDLLRPLSAEDRQTLTRLLTQVLAQHEPR